MTRGMSADILIPKGRLLLVQPPYVHYSHTFIPDASPQLPVSLLYAGELIERLGNRQVAYHDCAFAPISSQQDDFNGYGITVMGAQNIASAWRVYNHLKEHGKTILIGGQGVSGLTDVEFQKIFPNAVHIPDDLLRFPGFWDINIDRQLDKISSRDLAVYLSQELVLPLGQNCRYTCTFCGAQNGQPEQFYNTQAFLSYLSKKARSMGIADLNFYCTSLDMFQSALSGQTAQLSGRLRRIVRLQEEYGIRYHLRASSRADSYLAAENYGLAELARDAGLEKIAFGIDGSLSSKVTNAIHKGDHNLAAHAARSAEIASRHGLSIDWLCIFGLTEEHKVDKYIQGLKHFTADMIDGCNNQAWAGFIAKPLPGTKSWNEFAATPQYQAILKNPLLFMNLGFETLANFISHPDLSERREINGLAMGIYMHALSLEKAASFLTIPIMENDGRELLDPNFSPVVDLLIAHYDSRFPLITLENLPEYRERINALMPKDL